jgi:hypothetical protein
LYTDLIAWTQSADGTAVSLAEIVDAWRRQAAALQE